MKVLSPQKVSWKRGAIFVGSPWECGWCSDNCSQQISNEQSQTHIILTGAVTPLLII